MKSNTIAAIHAAIVAAAFSSPWWLDWRLLGLGAIVYWLQIYIFKGCVLTIAEFGTAETTFVGHYLQRLLGRFGVTLHQRRTKFVLDWLLPPTLLLLALLLQT